MTRLQKECLCWNCNAYLAYLNKTSSICCHNCQKDNIVSINNNPLKELVDCTLCQQSLLVPKAAYRIFCSNCNTIFVSPHHLQIFTKGSVM